MAEHDDPPYARAPEPADLARICRGLTEAGARYVLIGGFAIVAHGGARFTKDIDLLVDDAPDNVALVKRALSVLADNAAADVADTDVRLSPAMRAGYSRGTYSRVAELRRSFKIGSGSAAGSSHRAHDALPVTWLVLSA